MLFNKLQVQVSNASVLYFFTITGCLSCYVDMKLKFIFHYPVILTLYGYLFVFYYVPFPLNCIFPQQRFSRNRFISSANDRILCTFTSISPTRWREGTRAISRFVLAIEGSEVSKQQEPHLWPRMPRDQTGQLQGLALSDSIHPLSVALLLDVARVTGVDDPDVWGGCVEGKKTKEWYSQII